jgi:predicted anti-sigma-YlaC factor YlaD
MHDVRPIDCERTRQQISAALDSELSQLERLFVRHHVGRCRSCRDYSERVALATRTLRATPPERLQTRISVPSRRRTVSAPARIARMGSAAAAMVALVFLALLSAPEHGSSGAERALVGAALLEQPGGTNDLLAEVRRPTLSFAAHQTLAYRSGGIGAYKPLLPAIL